MTAPERNRAVFRRYYEAAVSEGAYGVFDEVLDPDVVPHTPFGGDPRGVQWIKDMVALERRAFPDLRLMELSSVAEGDRVAAHLRVTATHRGPFLGIEPTGRAVAFEEMMIARFHDGRIAELWAIVDTLSLLQQLGVVAPGLLDPSS